MGWRPSGSVLQETATAPRACLTARAVGSGGCQLLEWGGRVVRRHEFTDQAWTAIQPLLPSTACPGGQWADHRRVVNGIFWKLSTGVPWRDLPERYGPWQTCYERFRRWQADGTWQRLLAHAQTRSDAVGRSTGRWWWTPPPCGRTSTPPAPEKGTIRLRRVGCGGRPGTGTQPRWAHHQGPPGLRRPRAAAGDAGHCRAAAREHPAGAVAGHDPGAQARAGRPRKRPAHLVADRGYSYPGCRRLLRRRHIAHTIPERSDQQAARAAGDPGAAGHPTWMRCATSSEKSSSGPSRGSRSTAPSRPGTTSWPTATTPGWCWLPYCYGSPPEPSDRP